MHFALVLLLAFYPVKNNGLLENIEKVVDFGVDYFDQFNFDGLLGYTIAEAQLSQIQPRNFLIDSWLTKLNLMKTKLLPLLPRDPPKMLILEKYLLKPKNWMISSKNSIFPLKNLGIYSNWTRATVLSSKHADYKGVPSDHCLLEILNENCYISPFCHEMMLATNRIDTGYLLTHRLLYLQVMRLKKCAKFEYYRPMTYDFCSLIWRESRTSQVLGYPNHDLFLEQTVLCGIEGFSEFLTPKWQLEIVSWQKNEGCFDNGHDVIDKRSSNFIGFGCTDHSTGLGAAALALYLKQAYLAA